MGKLLAAIRDWSFKRYILHSMLSSTVEQWKKEVRDKDLDQYYCCNGHECGCMGMSVRQLWEYEYEAPDNSNEPQE